MDNSLDSHLDKPLSRESLEFPDCLPGRYSGEPALPPPPQDTAFSAAQLAQLMQPRNLEDSPFKDYQDLSMYEKNGQLVTPGRSAQDMYKNNEEVFQREVRHRIANGDIDKDTLVVAITGHGPTIGYEMAKQFSSDIFSRQPADKQDRFGLAHVKLPQEQTFAKATHDILSSRPRLGASTFLDVDLHLLRKKSPWGPNDILIGENLLPRADELNRFGIKKVLLLEEKPPRCSGITGYQPRSELTLDDGGAWLNPLFHWLNDLKRDGRLRVNEDGIDARTISDRSYVPVVPTPVE